MWVFLVLKINYRPPKRLRALFIAHYAPLLLIILIGPMTTLFHVFAFPFPEIPTRAAGLIIFFIGAFVYLKWEHYWYKTYSGQLVTGGIFQYIRHPHYASLLIIGFALSFFFYSIAAFGIAILSVPLMIWSTIDEEHLLLRQYNEEYKLYMKQVPWRLIPRIF